MPEAIKRTSPADAEAVWVVRDRVKFMGEFASNSLAVVDLEVPPGSGSPPHRHASLEIFRVTEGEMTFGLFGDGPPEQIVCRAGDIVTVPTQAGHNYTNNSGRPAAMTVVVEKQMLAFFRDLGRRDRPAPGPPDEKEIAEIRAACARHGVELLRVPPS